MRLMFCHAYLGRTDRASVPTSVGLDLICPPESGSHCVHTVIVRGLVPCPDSKFGSQPPLKRSRINDDLRGRCCRQDWLDTLQEAWIGTVFQQYTHDNSWMTWWVIFPMHPWLLWKSPVKSLADTLALRSDSPQ
jgi:hypothetical protein